MNYTFSETFVKHLIAFLNNSPYQQVAGIIQLMQKELEANEKKAKQEKVKSKSKK